MPKEYDEAWEYYAPDPEVEWAVNGRATDAYVRLPKLGKDKLFKITRARRTLVNPERSSFADSRELFIYLWTAGYVMREIAEVFSFQCLQTVKNWRKKLGLPIRGPGMRRATWTAEQDEAIRTLPAKEAAKKIGKAVDAVYRRRAQLRDETS